LVVEPQNVALEPVEWSLAELAHDRLEDAVASLERAVAALEARRAELDPAMDGTVLLGVLDEYERLVASVWRLSGWASLAFAANTQSDEALARRNRTEQALTEVQNRTLFLTLWIQELEETAHSALLERLERAGASADLLFFLADLRRLAPYRLDERSEQIINLKDQDGISGVLTLYSMITNALEFRPAIAAVEAKGESLTRDELMSYAYSAVASEREAAYRELHRVYATQAKVLGQMYVHRVQDWHNENVRLRGYASPIGVRNVSNDVPDQAVEALLDVVCESAGTFQRFFRLKASWLGHDRLRRFDLYAPIAPSTATVPYGEAVPMVLDTFAGFSDELAAHARRVFDQRHIDAQLRRGKKGGAFCATVLPELTPWVLVNYSNRLRDVTTLAHELGHAVHSMMAAGHSVLTQHPSLPLAETASVFAEMLVIERLLEERKDDPLAQRELLAAAIDDLYATILRQAFFVRFELEAHDAIRRGAQLEELHDVYWRQLETQFGSSVELDPCFRREWVAIPHIYSTPFYCYAYSFGQLLVLALYQRYREEGAAFVPGYLELLAYGGAERPQKILERSGVDVTDAGFWRGGMAVVEEMIDRLERIEVPEPASRPGAGG
jgi:oligoendopeptidase F